ncbi:hypothetical protein SLS57_007725 [Botryosphaeria dothidea]
MASGDESTPGPRPRRDPRLRLACSRCQRRKIRCDGAIPCCNNCRKAGAECIDGDSVRNKDLPRAYVTRLKARIAWLESVVRERCPDINLSSGLEGDFPEASGVEESPLRPLPGPRERPTSPPSGSAPRQPPSADSAQPSPTSSALSHEIGLVSLAASQDPKYIGPSSGHLLAKLMLPASARGAGRILRRTQPTVAANDLLFLRDLMETSNHPVSATRDQAINLSATYFDVVHTQYPILHRPTFLRFLDHIYESESPDPTAAFQVYMVLAISATVLSQRLKISLPAEGYCAFAMEYFDCMCIENSIKGLQSLLLLLIFTLHCPSMKLNAWYLNYQCIAALIDLGLQREINTSSGISLLEQEMRTRIFWVVFSLDRSIATMMGRPIGLRDEACELRLPQDIDDDTLSLSSFPNRQPNVPSHMSHSIHLFRLAKLNSEIKYVANSIVRDSPSYAYPNIINIHDWQSSMLQQLDRWVVEIPRSGTSETYIDHMCNLRYHSMRMLLLRPSPAIPSPSMESLRQCHHSAISSLRLFDALYKQDLLVHNWITFHSLILSIITMFYCICNVPEIARNTELDVLISDLRISLGILSATGEHWPGAKRSRDLLEEMAASIIRRTMDSSPHRSTHIRTEEARMQSSALTATDAVVDPLVPLPLASLDTPSLIPNAPSSLETERIDAFDAGDIFNHGEVMNSANLDSLMLDMFEDFISPLSTLL